MSQSKLTRDDCVALLKDKYEDLLKKGEQGFPKRSDFSDDQVVAIKAFLGPWPRALEAAGLKTPRDDDKAQKNIEKRILKKRARNLARRSQNKKEI